MCLGIKNLVEADMFNSLKCKHSNSCKTLRCPCMKWEKNFMSLRHI